MLTTALRTLLILCALSIQQYPISAVASDPLVARDWHFTLYRTWGLAPPQADNAGKIIAYLPERYLVLPMDARPVTFAGQPYLRVLTIDGVETLVTPDVVSSGSFGRLVGNHDLIFHVPYALCSNPECLPSDSVLSARGDAYRLVGQLNGWWHIRALRDGQRLDAYLSAAELERLIESGLVTDLNQLLPSYHIEKLRLSMLDTDCGEVRAQGDHLPVFASDSAARRVSEMLQLGVLDDTGLRMQTDYGAEGYQHSFYLYRVTPTTASAGSPFEVAMEYITKCKYADAMSSTTLFIEHARYSDSRNLFNNEPLVIDIPAHLFRTPENLHAYTGAAYMISINKPEHFERAMEILTGKIGDRSLVGYVLTELNRSCRSDMRVPFSGSACRVYDY